MNAMITARFARRKSKCAIELLLAACADFLSPSLGSWQGSWLNPQQVPNAKIVCPVMDAVCPDLECRCRCSTARMNEDLPHILP